MAGSKSDAFEIIMLKLVTGQAHGLAGLTGTLAGPFLALYTVAPSDSAAGTEVSTSGTAYTRVTTSGLWGTPAGASPASVSNSGVITFPTCAGTNWGTLVAFALFDAVTGGNRTYWGDLTDATKVINVGDTASFPVSTVVLSED
jgi:hypothetical protein